MIVKFFNSLRKNGPLGTVWRICTAVQNRFERVAVCQSLCLLIKKFLYGFQIFLDSRFDKIHGTDTSGVIPIKDLEIKSENIKEANWYGPMPVKVFRQIMDNLTVDFDKYEFINLGSGKGRVLLLASEYGFRKVTGVEFASDLHRISSRNIAIVEHYTRKKSRIESICMDATKFVIPEVPVVLFFHSPFKGQVMERVIRNILRSFAKHPRKIVLIFYGNNSVSIDLLKATQWPYTELSLHTDWSRFTKFRSFIFYKSPNLMDDGFYMLIQDKNWLPRNRWDCLYEILMLS
jgi:predicted RNA methylase